MCSVGYNNVDFKIVVDLGLKVVYVLFYFFYVVVEYIVGLILVLNRKLYWVYNCVRDDNFFLEGLFGFDFYGIIVGVIGIGKIGLVFV